MMVYLACPECGEKLPIEAPMCYCCGISQVEMQEIRDEWLLKGDSWPEIDEKVG